MLFNSYEFIFLFVPVAFFGFFRMARHSTRAAAAWLVAASLFFYGWWNPQYVLLLLGSIAFNYFAAGAIADAGTPRRRKALLCLAVAANLSLLGVYKYANFFIATVNDAGGFGWSALDIVLPLGISFFTFTQIAFLVDVHRGITRDSSIVNYLLFVTYFPHLIAGPLLHHKQMMPQFARPEIYRLDPANVAAGLTLFTIGLAKKVLLADNFAVYATPVFGAAATGEHPHFFAAWSGTLAYTLQIYFDFSGYSDMALGISRLFNIHLPVNFNSPYKSRSIVDFWHRWHMTLSQFLRDYLYIPLGGNRRGRRRRYLALMTTMLLGGLWHGANWTFVIWGALHGGYLVINHAWAGLTRGYKVRSPLLAQAGGVLSIAITFLAVTVAWVFFRAADLATALLMLNDMFALPSWPFAGEAGGALEDYKRFFAERGLSIRWFTCLTALGLAIVWFAPNAQSYVSGESRLRWRIGPVTAVVWGGVLAWCMISMVAMSEFLYFQF